MTNPSQLHVLTRWERDLVTIALQGELDVTSAPRAQRCLAAVLSKSPSRLVIDLAGLRFMDSQGLKLIARACRGVSGRGVVIRDPNPSVGRMLTLTGIDQVCTIEGQRPLPLPDALN